ncbi:hypothetical protein FOZ61_000914 [Perkinsus olseni]|uniref:Uncharacterized protein n=1 Tax=Perkinsus olseni TaxID=32597 RepID=A0A7J6MQZ3_PEROL|nr:hypothetical protein FOZ61_000914 [Perkinsus olseni]KAF4673985.1 hypothetical protein FOL46_006021 [Perkinsus olseni]
MTMRPAASESPRGSPPKASSSPSRGVNLAPSSSSSSALTPDQEATVQEAVMEQLMNYGEGMVSKEHRATLAEYAACVLQTQTTVSEMVSEMEQFLQGNAESFVEWLITFCESHGLAHPERKATKATPRGGGLFSKALRAATGQPPAGSSGPATASNGASPTGGAGGLLTGSGKKRGAEDESCSPDGANKIARREMRAIAQQADAVNANRAFTPLGSHNESRHPVRLVGRKELNQRAVATVRRSLGESPAGE